MCIVRVYENRRDITENRLGLYIFIRISLRDAIFTSKLASESYYYVQSMQ